MSVTPPSRECRSSGWVRARRTGILHLDARLGQEVADGERLDDVVAERHRHTGRGEDEVPQAESQGSTGGWKIEVIQ